MLKFPAASPAPATSSLRTASGFPYVPSTQHRTCRKKVPSQYLLHGPMGLPGENKFFFTFIATSFRVGTREHSGYFLQEEIRYRTSSARIKMADGLAEWVSRVTCFKVTPLQRGPGARFWREGGHRCHGYHCGCRHNANPATTDTPSWAATTVTSARACWSVRRPQEGGPCLSLPVRHRQSRNYSQNPAARASGNCTLAPSIEGRSYFFITLG